MSACPTADALDRLIRGQLDPAEGASVDAHVEECASCQRILEDLTSAPIRTQPETEIGSASAVVRGDLDRLIGRRPIVIRRDPERQPAGFAQRRRSGGSELPRIAGFEIIREVGRGGMGIVYEAIEQALGRRIALKVVPPFAAGPSTAARFRREARAAGRLHHTNIVPIFGVGSDGDLLYCAMQFIDGEGLDRMIERLRGAAGGAKAPAGQQTTQADGITTAVPEPTVTPSPAAVTSHGKAPVTPSSGASSFAHARMVARIGRQVAEALEYAHNSGFLHRDIKPSNILLEPGGTALVADFGLAKSADPEEALTQTGDIVGTLRYLPPERFDGQSDARGDVYALGATLYELLTLRPAFEHTDRTQLIERVLKSEPIPPRQLDRRVPRDLETVILKAMSKEPARRYHTAGQMAEDLRRFLDGEPITARRVTVQERVVRWARRRPDQAALAGLLAGVTILGFAGVTTLWLVAAAARDRARAADSEARSRGAAERRARYQAAIAAANSALELNNFDSARVLLDSAPENHRNWEWRYIDAQLNGVRTAFLPPDGPVSVFALAPDGHRIAYAVSARRDVRVRVPGSPADLAVLRGNEADIRFIAFSPNGSRVAAGASDGTIHVWEVAGGRPVAVLHGERGIWNWLTFSGDGTSLVSCLADKTGSGAAVTAYLWDVAGGRCRARFPALDVQFSPDGRTIVARRGLQVHLRDAATGAELLSLIRPGQAVRATAFSPDGTHVATGVDYPESRVYLWDLKKGGEPVALDGHKNNVHLLVYSPDGRVLASASSDRTVRLWDPATGRSLAVLRGHRSTVSAAAFTADGRRIITVAGDLTAYVWNSANGELLGSLRSQTRMRSPPQVSRDASALAIVEADGAVSLWDIDASIRRGILRGHKSYVYDVAIGPDSRTVASVAWDGTVRLWDAGTGRASGFLPHAQQIVVAVVLSPDGRRAFSIARDRRVHVWDVATAKEIWSIELAPNPNGLADERLAISPNGDLLAVTGVPDGRVRLHDAETGILVGELIGHEAATTDVAFGPDGSRIASADRAGVIRIWDTATRAPLAAVPAHDAIIERLAFSPDGKAIASASYDKTVRIWDVATLRELAVLQHGGPVYGLAFHPDGSRLAAACGDNTIRLWDTATFEEVAELRGHEDYVHAVAFSADGTRLVSGSGDYTVRVWNAPLPGSGDGSRDAAPR